VKNCDHGLENAALSAGKQHRLFFSTLEQFFILQEKNFRRDIFPCGYASSQIMDLIPPFVRHLYCRYTLLLKKLFPRLPGKKEILKMHFKGAVIEVFTPILK